MTIAFGLLAIACALGWLNSEVACTALVKHIVDKGVDPSDRELRACVLWAWKKLLHIK